MSPSQPQRVEINRLMRGRKYRACIVRTNAEQQPEDDRIVSFHKVVEIELGIQDDYGEEIYEVEWIFHLEEPVEMQQDEFYYEPLEWVIPDAFIQQVAFYEYDDNETIQPATAGLRYYDGIPVFHYELN